MKRFTATSPHLAYQFYKFKYDAENIPDFLVQGITYLQPKRQDCQNPSKYRPINSLCTFNKKYTACIAEKIQKHLDANKLLAEEQIGCIKNPRAANNN
jgi:hypothetical protein